MIDKTPPQEMYEFNINTAIPIYMEKLQKGDVSAKRSLYTRYRTLAVLEWHLHKDALKYRAHLKTALTYERERFMEVHEKDPSIWYHCPEGYAETVLLTGDFAYAKEYAVFVDDHNHKKPSSFEPWSYYILMYLMLGRYKDTLEFNVAKLKKSFEKKEYEKIRPEYGLFEALVNRDRAQFHTSLQALATTHKGTGKLFSNYEDKLLCLTGLSLANLAIGLGMTIDFDHPFVPKALLGK